MIKELLSYIASDNSILLTVTTSALGVASGILTHFLQRRLQKNEERQIQDIQNIRATHRQINDELESLNAARAKLLLSEIQTSDSFSKSKRAISASPAVLNQYKELINLQSESIREYSQLLAVLKEAMADGSLSDSEIQDIMQMVESLDRLHSTHNTHLPSQDNDETSNEPDVVLNQERKSEDSE